MAELDGLPSWGQVISDSLSNGVGALVTYLVVVFNQSASGHVNASGDVQVGVLAGYGLAQSVQNALQIGPALGIANALNTLVSQANGAGNKRQCVIYFGQGRAVLTLQWLLVAPIGWFSASWLVAIGLDPVSAEYAQSFNRINVISWWFRSQMVLNRKFLANINYPIGNLKISCICTTFHVLLLALVVGLDMLSLTAIAVVTVLSTALQPVLLFLFCEQNAEKLGFEKEWYRELFLVWKDWGPFLKLAIPGMLQSIAEFWSLEVFTFMSAYLGTPSLAACTVTYNLTTIGFLVCVGVGDSTSGLVGEAIGKGKPEAAKQALIRCGQVALLFWAPMGFMLLCFSSVLAQVFSNQESVLELLVPCLQIFAVALLMDTTCQVGAGALRALNQPWMVTFGYLIVLYAFMLPLSAVFAFPAHLGVAGMFIAYTIGSATIGGIQIAMIQKTDFASCCAAQEKLLDSEG